MWGLLFANQPLYPPIGKHLLGWGWVSSLQFDQIHTSFRGGGRTNPLEKYDCQISPEFGLKTKPIWNHHVVLFWAHFIRHQINSGYESIAPVSPVRIYNHHPKNHPTGRTMSRTVGKGRPGRADQSISNNRPEELSKLIGYPVLWGLFQKPC